MAEKAERAAGVLLRAVAKVVDLIIILAMAEVLPKAGYLAGIGYMLIGDGLFEGKSIGKKLLRLKTVSMQSGAACSVRESILRNITFAAGLLLLGVPFIGWMIMGLIFAAEFIILIGSKEGMRIGDEIAKTSVVETTQTVEVA